MNTMQQRLGVPHVTGHLGSQNGILSNYYYYQNNPTVSLSNSNNEIIGQAQVTATKEEESRPTSSKTASMAQNVAAAGENHLCLLYEVFSQMILLYFLSYYCYVDITRYALGNMKKLLEF